ncbi:MAG: RsmB/NOP family class I SAM-dependent RNA methyltransferase [Verrucomicrobia bacterium]|nr:RsmB/NOP family class I SAM-dependent RNA methyltransferase [Verrucomicrobiota bacterium]
MSLAGSQQRTFLHLLVALRPEWHRDENLPARIQALLARNRAFGSRDRRLYRELIYTTLRHLPWIEPLLDTAPDRAVKIAAWLAADTPATSRLRAELTADWPALPVSLAERAAFLQQSAEALLPAWFREHSPEVFAPAELDAQLRRAPLWLRLQTDDPAAVLREFEQRGWATAPSPILPGALQVFGDVDVTQSDAYQRGAIEVQDLGSQLLLETAGLTPGGRWLDACAGAGGKTLQLARLLGPSGHVDAYDVRPAALRELALRAARAGLKNIAVLPAPATATYDGVLVDAPCSGTGTWRRSPHLKWTTTARRVSQAAAQQQAILAELAPRVRPGGRLIYATCSLSRQENEDVIAAFLAQNPAFAPVPPAQSFGFPLRGGGLTFLPARHDTDGFFVASLQRT